MNENINNIYEQAEKYKKEMQSAFNSAKAQITLYFTEFLKENGLDGQVKKISGGAASTSLKSVGKVGRFEVEDGSLAFVYEDKGSVITQKTMIEFAAANWLRYDSASSPKATMERIVKEYERYE